MKARRNVYIDVQGESPTGNSGAGLSLLHASFDRSGHSLAADRSRSDESEVACSNAQCKHFVELVLETKTIRGAAVEEKVARL